jgi:hypothetical protein
MSLPEINRAERAAIRHINDRGWDIVGPYGAGTNAQRKRTRTNLPKWVHPSERERVASLLEDRVLAFLATERVVGGGSVAGTNERASDLPIPVGYSLPGERRLLVVKGETVIGDFRVP